MKVDDINKLIEKAKSRKDGVYSYNGYLYAVKAGEFVAYAEYSGDCYTRFGMFNVRIGRVARHERKNALKTWLKTQ